MNLVPSLLATAVVLFIICLALGAYQYWDREPEKAQAAAARVLATLRQVILAVYAVIRWPATLVIAWVAVIAAACVYVPVCLAWVLLKKVTGEPANITIKLA